MPTPDDRRAALVLLLVAALGVAAKSCRGLGGEPEGGRYAPAAVARPAADSVQAVAERLGRPLDRFEKIDVDRVEAAELTRLPRIGPALAARIVDDRARRGAFGSLEGLDRVPGIGPALLDALRGHVVFSGVAPGASARAGGLVALNTATADELTALPGIGPAKARAIVADRRRRGPFRSLEDLVRVPGIGPATVERLAGMVRVP